MTLPVAILAGGLATRLRPITEKIPKSLVEVAGEPFIVRQLDYLRRQKIRDVVLCVGHLGAMIEAVVGDGSRFGLKVSYSMDGPVLLGTGGALRRAWGLLGEASFVLYGDSYLPVDFSAIEAGFQASRQPALMTVLYNQDRWDKSNVLFVNGKLLEYNKDAPRPDFTKLQPVPANQPQPQLAMNAGDLTLGRPPMQPPMQPQERPRTIREAYAQQNRLPGVQMRQEGGVHNHAIAPSLNVKVTGFAEYDQRFIAAVSQHWFDLLDSRQFALDRTGKVTLQFRLNYDGSISEMRFADNTVGDLLGYVCQKAVTDAEPYEPFPSDMRRKLGDHCDVQFTFYYAND